MAYDGEKDEYICAQGRKLRATAVKTRKSETGHVQKVTVYECESLQGMPRKREVHPHKKDR